MIKRGEVKSTTNVERSNPDAKKQQSSDESNILRPQTLAEYVGQEQVKAQAQLMLDAAKKRNASLDHVLIHGGPGLGKTTLAGILAKEMQAQLKVTSGPALEKQGDLASLLSSLEDGDVLFIDEIHRLKPVVEEILYSAMEDFVLDLVVGKGPTAKSMRISIPQFTLIGATTKPNKLSSPLRDRFGSLWKLDYYQERELEQILLRSAKILDFAINSAAAQKLAQCSRRTPRIANRMLRRLRDYCTVNTLAEAGLSEVEATLDILHVDQYGMNKLDRELLVEIIDKFAGGPVGLSAVAASMQEDKDTIAEITEPYLMQLGFLQRTHRGRIVTEAGKRYIQSI